MNLLMYLPKWQKPSIRRGTGETALLARHAVVHVWDNVGLNAAKVRIIPARNAAKYEQRTHEAEE